VLLVINGAPAVGKTTLARRYAAEHPLALVIDVDLLRTQLGGWQEHDESKAIARELAAALARAHLTAGFDVLVPQYVGRPDFIARLRGLADHVGTAFVEVVLTDDPGHIAERFRARRAALATDSAPHPEYDVDDASVEQVVAGANAGLLRDAAARRAMIVDVAGGSERAYEAFVEHTRAFRGEEV
jgi:predicted kinase